jgi:hypothetical protein
VADKVDRVEPEPIGQGQDIGRHVVQPLGGVDGFGVGIAIAPQVGGDADKALGQIKHDLLPEGGRRAIALDQHHGLGSVDTDFGTGRQDVLVRSWSRDHAGLNTGQGRIRTHDVRS